MLEALILLAIAALLGLYAARQLAPARWPAGMGTLRRLRYHHYRGPRSR
jgi:hypothetical protein